MLPFMLPIVSSQCVDSSEPKEGRLQTLSDTHPGEKEPLQGKAEWLLGAMWQSAGFYCSLPSAAAVCSKWQDLVFFPTPTEQKLEGDA